jgi:hypothetical protein
MDWIARVILPRGAKYFSLFHIVQTDSLANRAPIQREHVSLSQAVKRSGHSTPCSAEVKNHGAALTHISHGVTLN